MYLTQNEYVRNGGKKDMDKDMYNRYAFTACRTVDFYTSGRIYKDIAYYNGVENLPYERDLKHLITELIFIMQKSDVSGNNISSVSNEGYSESYQTYSVNDLKSAQIQCIKRYLSIHTDHDGTPLLYSGV